MARRFIPLLLLVLVLGGLWSWAGRGPAGDGSALDPGDGLGPAALGTRGLPEVELRERQALAGTEELQGGLAARGGPLAGRCLGYLDRAPIPAAEIRFLSGEEQLASGRSDGEGAFNVVLPAGGFESVEIKAPPGWWCVEHGLQDTEYLARFASSNVGPLRAQLVDSDTGEAIPDYILRIRDSEGWSETLISDQQGHLESTGFFSRGTLRAIAHEQEVGISWGGARLASFEHVPRGQDPLLATIPIFVGPTYKLEIENPGKVPLKRLRAFLEEPTWVDQVVDYPPDGVTVHPGDPPWVRFSWTVGSDPSQQLVLVDTGGRWLGSTPVAGLRGIQHEPLQVRLDPLLRVRGRIFDEDGEPVPRATVELIPEARGAYKNSRRTQSNGRGLFIIEGVRAGPYELFARDTRKGMAREFLSISPEAHDGLEVRLEPYQVAGDVAGAVTSLTGQFNGPLVVYLIPRETQVAGMPTRSIRIAWEASGASYEGRFRFEGVAHGEYRLRAAMRGVPFDVEWSQRDVRPPDEGLQLTVRDDKPRYRLGMQVRDAETGDWLPDAQVRILDGAGKLVYEGGPASVGDAGLFGDGEPIQWRVQHPGYIPMTGGRTEFDALVLKWWRNRAVVRLKKD